MTGTQLQGSVFIPIKAKARFLEIVSSIVIRLSGNYQTIYSLFGYQTVRAHVSIVLVKNVNSWQSFNLKYLNNFCNLKVFLFFIFSPLIYYLNVVVMVKD